MVQMWLMDPSPCGDRRLPHHCFPPKRLSMAELTKNTGAYLLKINTSNAVLTKRQIETVKKERNLSGEVSVTLDGQNETLDSLYTARTEVHDLAHLIEEGEAYFDLKNDSGKWIRIYVEKGDLLVVPAKKEYRFSLTMQNNVNIRRFFKS